MSELEFKKRMKQIRPWLEMPLDFERSLFEDVIKETQSETHISEMAPYVAFHNHMKNIWNMLDRKEGFVQVL